MAENDAWLAQVQEAALEPDLAICDPHHHLWDRREGRVERRYLADDMQAEIDASGHNVVSTVFIEHLSFFRAGVPEAMKYVGEVEFANGQAAMGASGTYGRTKVAAGIVGYADMTAGARVRAVLEAELRAAPDRLKGIRCTGAWDPNPVIARAPRRGMYSEAAFREGVAQCAPLGLSFDITARLTQLGEVADMVRKLPATTFILNHIGGVPGIGEYAGRRDEIHALWRKGLAEIARSPNVFIKLGGFAMEYCGFGWHERAVPPTSLELADATRRHYETAIELFGPDRAMFESNFPVDKVSCSYGVLWNSFKRITAAYSPADKAKLFHDTAVRAYRLG